MEKRWKKGGSIWPCPVPLPCHVQFAAQAPRTSPIQILVIAVVSASAATMGPNGPNMNAIAFGVAVAHNFWCQQLKKYLAKPHIYKFNIQFNIQITHFWIAILHFLNSQSETSGL